MNTTAIIEWAVKNENMALVSVIQQAVSLLLSLLIFIKSYDFQACLKSVRDQREVKRREKEKAKLLKFQGMLELARANQSIDLSKIALYEDNDSSEQNEEKEEPVLKIAKKKKRVNLDSSV